LEQLQVRPKGWLAVLIEADRFALGSTALALEGVNVMNTTRSRTAEHVCYAIPHAMIEGITCNNELIMLASNKLPLNDSGKNHCKRGSGLRNELSLENHHDSWCLPTSTG
jgi:hypothetical protein